MTQTPSIGRIVHYVAYGTPNGEFKPAHRAAVITEVQEQPQSINGDEPDSSFNQGIKVCVLNPTGVFFSDWLYEDPDGKLGGSWHWPEYVK